MQVRVFQGFGENGVQTLEIKINEWLSSPDGKDVKVVRSELTAASVGPTEDRYQTVISMIWYTMD